MDGHGDTEVLPQHEEEGDAVAEEEEIKGSLKVLQPKDHLAPLALCVRDSGRRGLGVTPLPTIM